MYLVSLVEGGPYPKIFEPLRAPSSLSVDVINGSPSSKISLRKAVSAPSPTKMFLRQSRHTHEPSRKDYPSSLPFRERRSIFGNLSVV